MSDVRVFQYVEVMGDRSRGQPDLRCEAVHGDHGPLPLCQKIEKSVEGTHVLLADEGFDILLYEGGEQLLQDTHLLISGGYVDQAGKGAEGDEVVVEFGGVGGRVNLPVLDKAQRGDCGHETSPREALPQVLVHLNGGGQTIL